MVTKTSNTVRKYVTYFYFPEDYERLKEAAKKLGLNISAFIRSASIEKTNKILREDSSK